jgi:vacuolar-type H+-ATPase subunit I/STV1
MNKLLAIALICWMLGMLGLLMANTGYVVFGKALLYVFGILGVIVIFAGLVKFVRSSFIRSKENIDEPE